jgi:hypothetical protein
MRMGRATPAPAQGTISALPLARTLHEQLVATVDASDSQCEQHLVLMLGIRGFSDAPITAPRQ